MLNKEVCKKCRQGSSVAKSVSYDVNRDLLYTWACSALIAIDKKDSDSHVVDSAGVPPRGCPHVLEHAVSEGMLRDR